MNLQFLGRYGALAYVVASLFYLSPASAHEGHDTPGALPPAPHGGVVKEAEHKTAHAPGKNEEELFFEAVYKDKKIKIYPLGLAAGSSTFKVLKPNELSAVEAKVELPRSKKSEKIVLTPSPDAFEAGFDSKGANRFIVHVTATHLNEAKVAKLQIERN